MRFSPSKILLIIGLVCCAQLAAAHSSSQHQHGKIDSIIKRHWDNLYSSLSQNEKRSVEQLNSDSSHKESVIDNFSYKCQHDAVAERSFTRVKSKLPISRNESASYTQRHAQRMQTDVPKGSIRFHIDTSEITGTDNHACYSSGSYVQLGYSTTTRQCSDANDYYECRYQCQQADVLTNALKNLLVNNVIPAVIEIFETLLNVPRTSNALYLDREYWEATDRTCDFGIPIPESFITDGIPNVDYAVFFSARPSAPGVVAYAAPCNLGIVSQNPDVYDRPLAGYVNFCPSQFTQFASGNFNEFAFAAAVKVGVHEFTHALGFTSAFYDSYVDSTTNKRYTQPAYSKVLTGSAPSGAPFSQAINYLSTPRLLATAQNYYGCNNIEGVPLEEFGGSGTAGSHWEARITQNEYMNGFVSPLMPISVLTLSLFEDMGWYYPNYDSAEYWGFGKDQGCSFVNDRCESGWTRAAGKGYFCGRTDAPSCSADRVSKASCNVGTYENSLPAYYQHFTNPAAGGADRVMDCCPTYEPDVYCVDESNNAITSIGEEYSPSSLCWEYTTVGGSIDYQNPNMACWKHSCDTNRGVLQVVISGNSYDCPKDGGEINAGVVKLNCPTYSQICRKVEVSYKDPSSAVSHLVSIVLISVAFIFSISMV